MGFADSLKKVIGLEEIDEDEILTDEELQADRRIIEREPKREKVKVKEKERERERDFTPPYKSTGTTGSSSRSVAYGSSAVGSTGTSSSVEKRASLARSGSLKLILIEPKSIDECPKLVDSLKARKPVIINLEKLETDSARKIFDFLSGATYALDGNVQKIANNIFIFTPDNVSVAAQQALEAAELNRWR